MLSRLVPVTTRIRSGVTIDRKGFEENRIARLDLGGDGPYVMLSVLPAAMDFDLGVTTNDHFLPERDKSGLRALAVVVNDSMGEAIAKLYFSYFPQLFHTRVFHGEQEARAWLHALPKP